MAFCQHCRGQLTEIYYGHKPGEKLAAQMSEKDIGRGHTAIDLLAWVPSGKTQKTRSVHVCPACDVTVRWPLTKREPT